MLHTLPPELIELIAKKSEPQGLLALRLVCKHLNQGTFKPFSRTWFTERSTNLNYQSLRKLKEVSEHEGLKYLVQDLIVRTGPSNTGQDFSWTHESTGHLGAPSPGFDELRDILLDLTNCTSFKIHQEERLEEVGQPECLRCSDAVAGILDVFADITLPAKSFHVDFGNCGALAKGALRLYFPRFRELNFVTTWRHFQKLTLEYAVSTLNIAWSIMLILYAVNLQELKLVFDTYARHLLVIDVLAGTKGLPKLRKLFIGSVRIPSEDLMRFVLRFRENLCELSFGSVILLDDSWMMVHAKILKDMPLLDSVLVVEIDEIEDDQDD